MLESLDLRDIILTICSIAFGYALIPQVIYSFRKKMGTVTLQTSAITCTGLYTIAGVYVSLNLWFAAAACAITATLWLILLIQRLIYGDSDNQ